MAITPEMTIYSEIQPEPLEIGNNVSLFRNPWCNSWCDQFLKLHCVTTRAMSINQTKTPKMQESWWTITAYPHTQYVFILNYNISILYNILYNITYIIYIGTYNPANSIESDINPAKLQSVNLQRTNGLVKNGKNMAMFVWRIIEKQIGFGAPQL